MPFGSLDLRLVMFHDVMRTLEGADGRAYERVAGISVFLGKLGSAVVSSDLGALGESESETVFLRGFFAGVVDAPLVAVSSAASAESVPFRFDLAGDAEGEAGVGAACSALVAAAVRLEARRAVVLVGVAGAIVLAVNCEAICNPSART